MAKDLTAFVTEIFNARTLREKKEIARKMIRESHAKKETKKLALLKLEQMSSAAKVEKFCTNYMLSGEGLKV